MDGTTIISNYWKSYDCLKEEGFVHLKVNHKMNFKDSITGAHTNGIESSWRAAKAIVSSSGRRKTSITGNLARYMFYKRCNELNLDRTAEFLKLAGQLYNPMIENLNEDNVHFEDSDLEDGVEYDSDDGQQFFD